MGHSFRLELSNERHIGSAAALVGYGILTVSDQSLGVAAVATRGSRRGPSVAREAQTGGSGLRFRSSSRSISWRHARAPPAGRASAAPSAHPSPLGRRGRSASIQFPSPPPGLRHQPRTGREVGKPDIKPVVGRIAFLPNAARRTPHRADPSSLLRMARFTQSHDPQCHDGPIAVRARDVSSASARPVRCGRTDRGRTTSERPGSTPRAPHRQPHSLGLDEADVAAPPGDQGGQRSPDAHRLWKARVL